MKKEYKYTKYACYAGCASQAAVICLSPVLFVTFHERYGISYTLLGLLAVFNFCSQLIIDLIFSFFSSRFNISKTVKLTPLITVFGILLFALLPMAFPQYTYACIVVGTIVFSVASGLCEVLLSPTIAALTRGENAEREMSRFHSVYAWGVVAVVVISTVFLKIFGVENWNYLALFWTLLPLLSFILFAKGEMPQMDAGISGQQEKASKKMLGGIMLFVLCIFFGSAAENTMTQWCSGYIETVLGIEKFWGDILGMALFSVMLGVSRTLYGKYGKSIYPVMLVSFCGAAVCYVCAALCPWGVAAMVACVLCGLFVSMLWPGTIIWTENTFKGCGVVVYAMLAAGGDLGASVAPQLMGSVTDKVAGAASTVNLAQQLSLSADQIGLKAAMLVSAVFPLCGIILALIIKRKFAEK